MAKDAIDLAPVYTVKSIPEDTRADIEDLLETGLRPKQVHDQHYPEIPIKIIQSVKRAMVRKEPEDTEDDLYADIDAELDAAGFPPIQKTTHKQTRLVPLSSRDRVPVNPEVSEMAAKLERLRIQKQVEEMEDELNYMRRRRQIQLEREELDLERKRREIYHTYGEDEEQETTPDQIPSSSPFPFTESGDENGLVRDILRFLTVMAQKPPKQQASPLSVPTMTAPDPTKPLSDEQIRAEISRYTPEQIAQAQSVPDSVIEWQLKQRFPGILPENINRIVHQIRHYAHNSQRTSDSPQAHTSG